MAEFKVDEQFVKEAHAAACEGWKKRIEEKFPDAFPRNYRVGDYFKLINAYTGDELYILALVDRNVKDDTFFMALICLTDGNRYRDPIKVKDHTKVVPIEWSAISGGNFEQIGIQITPRPYAGVRGREVLVGVL